ncbi:uncharacterized protein LOC108103788 [Drosophila eugracilis]|uniref:uncharacterized protein LOC108103788 n=1 Tax=Drosophila eugracilis TaxID=29029 RepID=UPI0007E6DF47|nr:uncharacterized protein LOC108103788 [Drosophila eugracilis]
MAEKPNAEDNQSLKSTNNDRPPNRLEARHRQQDQNNAVFARLFASLEGEHRKLKELEERRAKLTEEMRNLRALLFAENQKLRQSITPLPGTSPSSSNPKSNPIPIPIAKIAKNLPGTSSAGPKRSSIMKTTSRLDRKASRKSVTIAEPPGQSLKVSEKPKASSTQAMQKKGNRRRLKNSTTKSKKRKPLDNLSNTREDLLDELDESSLNSTSVGSNLRTLEQRRSDLEDRQDSDEVLVSLPALFQLLDSQLTDTNTSTLPNIPDTIDSKIPEEPLSNAVQDPSFYLPSADSLFKDILGTNSVPLAMDLPEVSLEVPSIGLAECSGNAMEKILENQQENMKMENDLEPSADF